MEPKLENGSINSAELGPSRDSIAWTSRSSSAMACCRCSVSCDCAFVAAISGCANRPPDIATAAAAVARSLLMGVLINVLRGWQLQAWGARRGRGLDREGLRGGWRRGWDSNPRYGHPYT